MGASHYLAKPFSNQELIDTVERVLRGEKVADPVGVLGKRLDQQIRAPMANAPVVQRDNLPAAIRRTDPVTGGPAWAIFGAIAAVVLGGALFTANRAPKTIINYSVMQKNPTALVWKGEQLWSADWLSQTVNEFRLVGDRLERVRSVQIPNTQITGLALSEDRLWICDPWKKVIQERRLDENFSLVATYKTPGPKPAGLYFDGRYLWSSDAQKRRFYRHGVNAELTVLESYPSPGRSPSSIYKDKDFFWSADSESRLIYKHRLDRQLQPIAALGTPGLDAGSASLSAFTIHGPNAWIARDGVEYFTKIPFAAFEDRTTREKK